jgi:putative ABC transport system permease protein
MRPAEFLRIAWQSLRSNSLRSLLTMLGIIIGVASVIIMVGVSAGTERTIEEQITGLGSNLIFISGTLGRGGFGGQPAAGGLVYDDVLAIADSVRGVAATAVEQQTIQTVRSGSAVLEDVPILGTTPGFISVRDIQVAQGRYLNQTEVDRRQKVAVLGAALAGELFGEADPIGQTVTVGSTKVTVTGVLAGRGQVGDVDYDSRLYLPITVVFQKFTPSQFARFAGDSVRLIYVKIEPGVDMEQVITQIELLLTRRHGVQLDAADFTITTQQDIIATQESATAAFRNLLAGVAGVSLIVGGIGIMNIMLVSVTERTREIGIRQAVGAAPEDIRAQFLVEALLLSLVGGLIGVLAGISGAWLFSAASQMRTVLLPASILLAFGSAAVVGMFFGYYPATRAARLDPIEALRHE